MPVPSVQQILAIRVVQAVLVLHQHFQEHRSHMGAVVVLTATLLAVQEVQAVVVQAQQAQPQVQIEMEQQILAVVAVVA